MRRASAVALLLLLAGCSGSNGSTKGPVVDRPTAPAVAGMLGAGFEAGHIVELGHEMYFIVGVTAENPRTLGVVLMRRTEQVDAQRTGVFGDLEWTCLTSAEVGATVDKGHVFLEVLCANGDPATEVRREGIVLRAPPEPANRIRDYEVRWAGTVDRVVTRGGCENGDGGKLELRSDELWRVSTPWVKADPGEDCIQPSGDTPDVRLDPPL